MTDESYEIIQVDEENYPELARALRTYEEECAADVARWRNGVLEAARAGHEGEGEYYTPFRYERKLSVKRADAQVFSICVQDVWNPNVAGVELISCGKDLDSQTGKELVLEDVVVVDERFIDTLIAEFYEQRPAEIPSISYVDAPEALIAGQFRPGQPAEDRPRWTLGNNGITFYYDSRMILEGTLMIEVDEMSRILVFDLNEGAPVYKGECFGWFCGGQMTSPDHFELGERINVLGGPLCG